jgi:hypothetical protein
MPIEMLSGQMVYRKLRYRHKDVDTVRAEHDIVFRQLTVLVLVFNGIVRGGSWLALLLGSKCGSNREDK